MEIGGWRTRAVFDRYNIVDERDIKAAAEKLHVYLGERLAASEKAASDPGSTPVIN